MSKPRKALGVFTFSAIDPAPIHVSVCVCAIHTRLIAFSRSFYCGMNTPLLSSSPQVLLSLREDVYLHPPFPRPCCSSLSITQLLSFLGLKHKRLYYYYFDHKHQVTRYKRTSPIRPSITATTIMCSKLQSFDVSLLL
jgi:hypothetical protein